MTSKDKPASEEITLDTVIGTPGEVLQRAVRHYNAGEFAAAAALCREVIRDDQSNSEAIYVLANIARNAANPDEALGLFVRAVNIDPTNPKYSRAFAEALEHSNRIDQAIMAWEQYSTLAPDSAEGPVRLANLLVRANKPENAEKALAEARRRNTDDGELRYMTGALLQQLAQVDAAIHEFRAALNCELRPEIEAECHAALAGLLRLEGQPESAILHGRRATEINAQSPFAYNNLGLALLEGGDTGAAVAALQTAMDLLPDNAEILNNLGVALSRLGRVAEAIELYENVLRIRPGWAEGHLNLANALRQSGQFEKAVQNYQTAISLRPDDYRMFGSLALTQMNQDEPLDAIASYEKALSMAPGNPELLMGLGIAQLLTGDFAEGWRNYEFRRQTRDSARRKFPGLPWNGNAMPGETLLVYSEQGFGDTLQFCRYLPLVQNKSSAKTIIFECQRPLCSLMTSLAGRYEIVARGDDLPQFDRHIGLMSLPALFETTEKSIPKAVPYLSPPADPKAFTKPSPGDGVQKVGLVWSGNPERQDDPMRSCPLGALEPLFSVPDVEFYSLQLGASESDRAVMKRHGVIDLSPEIHDFSDTAAAVAEFDLTISVDTAVAHLAGALGAPIWVLLGSAADWRYLRNRQDSPWYPTMQLMRQKRFGDWEELAKRAAAALQANFAD